LILILVLVKFFVLIPLDESFLSPGWVKINTHGTAQRYPGFAIYGSIFCGSMEEFIGGFSAFLGVQTTLVGEFPGVIYVMEETQRIRLTSVWLECDSALICVIFVVRTNVP